MTRPALADAFAHHIWASTRLLDVCRGLTAEQLASAVPGTFGSILDTARHLVGSDAWYLFSLTGDRVHLIDEDHMDLTELRDAIEPHDAAWATLLAADPDPDTILTEIDEDDGYRKDATIGIRLAQALHHGTDHRSQICTALTALGIEPPSIDGWDYGLAVGRVVEGMPGT